MASGRNRADVELGIGKRCLRGRPGSRCAAGPPRRARPRRRCAQGAYALDQHQRADHAEQDHVGERRRTGRAGPAASAGRHLDAGDGAEEAAADQEVAHLQVDVAAPPMAHRAGDGGGHDLAGAGADGHARRHAEKDQSGVMMNPPPMPNMPDRKPIASADAQAGTRSATARRRGGRSAWRRLYVGPASLSTCHRGRAVQSGDA